jgi:hypothetical protein
MTQLVRHCTHEAQINIKSVCLCESDLVHIGFQELEAYSHCDVLILRSQSCDDTSQKERPSLNTSYITMSELHSSGSLSF